MPATLHCARAKLWLYVALGLVLALLMLWLTVVYDGSDPSDRGPFWDGLLGIGGMSAGIAGARRSMPRSLLAGGRRRRRGWKRSMLPVTGIADAGEHVAAAIADAARVRGLLIATARAGEAVSYSGLLQQLGTHFTRPKMRALCRTLDAIDRDRADGEPALAVLVVRESDRLPGQGWWCERHDYDGGWTGPEASRYVATLQGEVCRYWMSRPAVLDKA